jgi:asparagine synthase (glutamine-hydrolysing)
LFAPVEVDGSNGHRAASSGSGNGRHIADGKDRVMQLELRHYLSHQLLRDTDQMSMAHSLEVRVPLLDDSMVRVALALPSEVRNERGKALLARAARLDAVMPKRPFALPFEPWMRGPLREHIRSGLLSEELPFSDSVPAALRRRLWESFEQRRVHWSRLWAITVLRTWPQANGFGW